MTNTGKLDHRKLRASVQDLSPAEREACYLDTTRFRANDRASLPIVPDPQDYMTKFFLKA
ncbi:hypothetical protein Tdes44962_MAKER02571 [Teratosphaeria destructans]|uniref:Uncharacterized protein n=1 Tax=Teratosphaeria destructans TaxID=418781 RepID=A0A9W7STG9_9PEZI|nr:hypothetical protein Tdes44962_MAKER02571 [Teratosphaeria destructans]